MEKKQVFDIVAVDYFENTNITLYENIPSFLDALILKNYAIKNQLNPGQLIFIFDKGFNLDKDVDKAYLQGLIDAYKKEDAPNE